MPNATYVYCIVKSARKPAVARVPKGLPRAGAARAIGGTRGLWLIVADVPLGVYGAEAVNARLNDLEWVAARAVRHEAVVEHFARRFDVVPMKLLTMFRTDDRAIANLDGRKELPAIFRRIAGCAEWSVRVTRVRAPAESRSPERRTGSRLTGTKFLLRRKAERDRSGAAAALTRSVSAKAFRSLSRAARDSVRKDPALPGTNLLLDAAFLVPKSRDKRFLAAARRAAVEAARAGCELTLSGPWPAYHFVATR